MDADLGYRLEVVAPHANWLTPFLVEGAPSTISLTSALSNHPVPFLEMFHIPNAHPYQLSSTAIPRRSGSSLLTATIPFLTLDQKFDRATRSFNPSPEIKALALPNSSHLISTSVSILSRSLFSCLFDTRGKRVLTPSCSHYSYVGPSDYASRSPSPR